jgi:hypothetical protein
MSTSDISWEVKAAGVQGWQPYHFHVPTVLKSVSFNLLEPPGPVQACSGIALPFTIPSTFYMQSNSNAVSVFTTNFYIIDNS